MKRRRPRWHKIAWMIGIAALGIGAWKGWEAAVPRYKLWKQARALEQAKVFIEKRDAPNAQLALEVAIREVPGNPETIRVAADMLEQVSAPQAMRLRRAVVQVVPDSAEDAARLVLTCIRFGDFNAAKDALSSTPPAVASQPAMLRAALAYAIATDDRPVADFLFTTLKTQNPESEDLKHAHALLQLKNPDAATRAQALQALENLAQQQPGQAPQIHRELAADALQRKDYAAAEVRLAKVLADPAATLNDRLQKANIDLLIAHRPFAQVFAEIAPHAAKNEIDAGQLVQWLLVQNRAADAAIWIKTLPPALQQSPALRSSEAELAAQLKDWDRLATLLEQGAWGRISRDTVRLAFAAQTVDNPARPSLRHETWDLALASAQRDLSTYRTLQRLAAVWQWPEESEQTLWTIARQYPDQTWAHQALFNLYRERKNTSGMRDIMSTLRAGDGAVARYQHDWSLLTMLLEPSSNWNPAKDIMQKLYETSPTNATYGTGYAFALAQAGKAADAAAVVAKFSDSEREYPPRQPYLAFIYGAAKQLAPFEQAVSRGAGGSYLPEESYLFTRGREELERKPEKPKAKASEAPKT